MVVISPRSIPRASLSTLATGARQLVVQLAFETTTYSAVSLSWLTPYTTVRSPPFAGAEISTRLAPAARCFDALSRAAQHPMHPSALSTPRPTRGRVAGARSGGT